jgi:hypothetical protein
MNQNNFSSSNRRNKRKSKRPRGRKRQTRVFDVDRNQMKLYPRLPNEMRLSLRTVTNVTHALGVAPVVYRIPLLELLTGLSTVAAPGYLPQLYQIYRYARVTAVQVKTEIQNQGTVPLVVAIAPISYADLGTITWGEAADIPRSIVRTVGPAAGNSSMIVRSSYNPYMVLGQRINSLNYAMTFSQSTASSPLEPEEPLLAIAIQASDGVSAWGAITQFDVVYHLEFFVLFADNA